MNICILYRVTWGEKVEYRKKSKRYNGTSPIRNRGRNNKTVSESAQQRFPLVLFDFEVCITEKLQYLIVYSYRNSSVNF